MWINKGLSLFLLQLFVVVFVNGEAATEPRIVNGFTTTIDNEPHIVQIFRDGGFKCGGSIIDPQWILTAAHCIYGFGLEPQRFLIRAGSTTITGNNGAVHQVEKIYRSSKYSRKTYNSDIALLKLKTPLTLNGSTIKAIPLCSQPIPTGAEVKVSGWGLTSQNGVGSNELRSVMVTTIPRDTCQTKYSPRKLIIAEEMFCASNAGKDSCSGDSGGPVVYNKEVCGIVSFGYGCAQPNFPGVYADVLNLKYFIDAIMKKK